MITCSVSRPVSVAIGAPALASGAVALAAMLVAACGDDDAFSPTTHNMAGSYSASTFTVTSSAGTVDLLVTGGEVEVTLTADGEMSSHIFLPGGGEDGEDFEADVTGTWTLTGSTVTLDHEGDTVLQDLEFTAGRDRLTAEHTFGEESVRIVLTRSD
jgi:hypothetical protein